MNILNSILLFFLKQKDQNYNNNRGSGIVMLWLAPNKFGGKTTNSGKNQEVGILRLGEVGFEDFASGRSQSRKNRLCIYNFGRPNKNNNFYDIDPQQFELSKLVDVIGKAESLRRERVDSQEENVAATIAQVSVP